MTCVNTSGTRAESRPGAPATPELDPCGTFLSPLSSRESAPAITSPPPTRSVPPVTLAVQPTRRNPLLSSGVATQVERKPSCSSRFSLGLSSNAATLEEPLLLHHEDDCGGDDNSIRCNLQSSSLRVPSRRT